MVGHKQVEAVVGMLTEDLKPQKDLVYTDIDG